MIYNITNQINTADIPGAGNGTLIVLSIGGNDLRSADGSTWPTVLSRCLTTQGACHTETENQIDDFAEVHDDAITAYTEIAEA